MKRFRSSHFVFLKGVVLSSEVKISIIEKGPQSVSFIERFSHCVLYSESLLSEVLLYNIPISLLCNSRATASGGCPAGNTHPYNHITLRDCFFVEQ